MSKPLDIAPLMRKSARFAWELMFTRSMLQTPDMEEQGRILARVAQYIDDGTLVTTTDTVLSPISAETLKKGAHARRKRTDDRQGGRRRLARR